MWYAVSVLYLICTLNNSCITLYNISVKFVVTHAHAHRHRHARIPKHISHRRMLLHLSSAQPTHFSFTFVMLCYSCCYFFFFSSPIPFTLHIHKIFHCPYISNPSLCNFHLYAHNTHYTSEQFYCFVMRAKYLFTSSNIQHTVLPIYS